MFKFDFYKNQRDLKFLFKSLFFEIAFPVLFDILLKCCIIDYKFYRLEGL